jgi:DNA polymerase-1
VSSVLLIDTFSLFFRSFFALPPMNTKDGRPTNALYGFSSILIKLWREERPLGTAFALDAPQATFRHRAYEGYKAQRQRAPTPLVEQLAVLDRLIEAIGAPPFRSPGFEADDVLATLTSELEAAGRDVLIASGDRDMLQLVSERTRVLFTGRRGKDTVIYDPASVEARFGIPPSRLPSYVALIGDPSDNIVGVPGIGPRTARDLVLAHSSIEGILASLEKLPPAVRGKIEAHAALIRKNEELTILRRDAPLADGPRFRALDGDAFARLRVLFEELEFKSLRARLDALAAET